MSLSNSSPWPAYQHIYTPQPAQQPLPLNLGASIPTAAVGQASPLTQAALPNGASGYFIQKPGLRQSALVLTLPMPGMSHATSTLLGNMIVGGSMSTKRKLEEWKQQGISVSLTNSGTQCLVRAEAPMGKEQAAMNAVMQLLTQPVVDPVMFNTVRRTLVQNYQGDVNSPDSQLQDVLLQRIYGVGHPLSMTTQEMISGVSQQTLQEVMAAHRYLLNQFAQAKVMMVSAQPVETQRQVVSEAIRVSHANGLNRPTPAPSQRLSPGTQRPVLAPNEDLKRALIKVMYQVPDVKDPDYPAFCLMRQVLTGTSAGSLFETLRTRDGLVYGVSQRLDDRVPQCNVLKSGVEVDFAQIGKTLDDFKQVTQALCDNPLPPSQLDAAKRSNLLSMREDQETGINTALFYAPWLGTPGAQPPDLEQLKTAFNQVTPEAIQRVAQRIFNDPKNFRLMGISAPAAQLQQIFPGQPLEKPSNWPQAKL